MFLGCKIFFEKNFWQILHKNFNDKKLDFSSVLHSNGTANLLQALKKVPEKTEVRFEV